MSDGVPNPAAARDREPKIGHRGGDDLFRQAPPTYLKVSIDGSTWNIGCNQDRTDTLAIKFYVGTNNNKIQRIENSLRV